jgi:hypothetical protein
MRVPADVNVEVDLAIDETALAAWVGTVAAEINLAPADARYTLERNTLTVTASRRGASLDSTGGLWLKRVAYALLLAFCLVIPSDWTQDVPERYSKRHPGLRHSALYPPLTPR